MRSILPVATIMTLLLTTVASQASRVRRGPTSGKQHTAKATTHAAPAHQRAIDNGRATEIQGALVKAGYLTEVSGHWDAASEAAMQKLQSDNGWQTKIIPDSRALIKLGLGPSTQSAGTTPAGPGSPTETYAFGSR